jgi:Cadherin domain
LDPETEFQLDVMAADCCGLSNNMSLMVNIIDVNDHAPTFKRPWYQYDLAEGNYMGWVLGWLHASDADFGENAQVVYYIDQEEGDLPFSISPEGGALTASGTIDRETGDSYEFRVWAEDSGKPKLKTSVQVNLSFHEMSFLSFRLKAKKKCMQRVENCIILCNFQLHTNATVDFIVK